MSEDKEVYLGDGIYGKIDGLGQIELRAPRGFEDHFVYINEDNIISLLNLIQKCFDVKITDVKITLEKK